MDHQSLNDSLKNELEQISQVKKLIQQTQRVVQAWQNMPGIQQIEFNLAKIQEDLVLQAQCLRAVEVPDEIIQTIEQSPILKDHFEKATSEEKEEVLQTVKEIIIN